MTVSEWSGRRDSNPRSPGPDPGPIPGFATSRNDASTRRGLLDPGSSSFPNRVAIRGIAPDLRGVHSRHNASITAFTVCAAVPRRIPASPSQSTPYLRTAHSVARLEIASCVGDDLSTGRMICCLDANDPGFKGSVILVHELDKFVLR